MPCRRQRTFHLGVDNLNVVRHVRRLLDGVRHPCPAELLKDGDLVLLIDRILELRGRDTVRVTKVQGHADEDMVQAGRVQELDRIGQFSGEGVWYRDLCHGVMAKYYPGCVVDSALGRRFQLSR